MFRSCILPGFISYQKKNDQEYATFCLAKWTGNAKINETVYLGRVVDKENGVFYSKKRGGLFTFSVKDGFGEAPEKEPDSGFGKRKAKRKEVCSLDYGDAFFLDGFLRSTPYYDVFCSIAPDAKDILLSLVYFYILKGGAREHMRDWWDGSYVCLMYPDAVPSGSKISKLYRKLSDPDLQLRFTRKYMEAVLSGSGIHGILIDSTGMPNAISMDKREVWNHDGSCDEGARLIYVCERNTGLPLAARTISGNIIDASTIANTIDDLERVGVCTDFAILDAGYYTDANIRLLHENKIAFVTRIKKNRKLYKEIFNRNRPGLEDAANLVSFNGRVLYIKKVPCVLAESIEAYSYIVLDTKMQGLESAQALSGPIEDKVNREELERIRSMCGTFMMVSSEELDPSEILPLYYTRGQIEQVFDIAKGSAELLQLGLHSEETFDGHVFVSFLAVIICHLLQRLFLNERMTTSEALGALRNHKCKLYDNGDMVPYESKKKQNLCYDLIKVKPQKKHFDKCPSIW